MEYANRISEMLVAPFRVCLTRKIWVCCLSRVLSTNMFLNEDHWRQNLHYAAFRIFKVQYRLNKVKCYADCTPRAQRILQCILPENHNNRECCPFLLIHINDWLIEKSINVLWIKRVLGPKTLFTVQNHTEKKKWWPLSRLHDKEKNYDAFNKRMVPHLFRKWLFSQPFELLVRYIGERSPFKIWMISWQRPAEQRIRSRLLRMRAIIEWTAFARLNWLHSLLL